MAEVACKTKMFKLLRLLDNAGVVREALIRSAWNCWIALPEETQEAMKTDRNANAADCRRVRLWDAAWRGGMEHVLTVMEEKGQV